MAGGKTNADALRWGLPSIQIFTMVILPSSIPTIISALKISVGMSWVGVIVGEYLSQRLGLAIL